MSTVLADHTLVVTGGSSGIGRSIATEAARAGARVVLTYCHNEAGARDVERTIAVMNGQASVSRLDVTDVPAIGAFANEVQARFGRIDSWINNAGADILTGETASLASLDKLDLLTAVDLRGTIAASWCAAEIMQRQSTGGVIINMSWDHAMTGMAGSNPELYAAVKGGVLSFSKALARSVAPLVRVNVLAPGWIETSFGRRLDDSARQAIADSVPLKRWGTPEDVAKAAIFLASPAASYLTGQTLFVGGGVVM